MLDHMDLNNLQDSYIHFPNLHIHYFHNLNKYMLYFLFQLPIVNAQIFKKFSFLSIYDADGNFNIYGLGFKSMLFGSIYYMFMNFFYFLMEI